jgi:hypothetical protein
MQKKKKAKEKNSFRRKERSVFKKSLTGPTLLEMPDKRFFHFRLLRRLFLNKDGRCSP